jgi:hypothetical protein
MIADLDICLLKVSRPEMLVSAGTKPQGYHQPGANPNPALQFASAARA